MCSSKLGEGSALIGQWNWRANGIDIHGYKLKHNQSEDFLGSIRHEKFPFLQGSRLPNLQRGPAQASASPLSILGHAYHPDFVQESPVCTT